MAFVKIVNGEWVEFDPGPQVAQAHEALRVASERIGQNNYRNGLYRPKYRYGKLVQGYRITEEHRQVIDAMPKLLKGDITPDEAMALLHDYDVLKQRLGS